jgi:PTH1 family peptidyl-tRNA hydrolase
VTVRGAAWLRGWSSVWRRKGPGTDMVGDAWVVVGLGNPGPTYARTPHNVGYLVCDVLAERLGSSWRPHKSGRAQVVEGRLPPLPGPRVVLGRARSYMNESGGPVAGLLNFYKVPPERLVVVHDELDLPPGTVRLKSGGGDNGHNGLKSIRASIGTGDFLRVRVGIGRPSGQQSPADYVLSSVGKNGWKELQSNSEKAADSVDILIRNGLEAAQNTYH